MDKFQRVYSLGVEVVSGAFVNPTPTDPYNLPVRESVLIELPYSLEFTIDRKNLASAQTATFRIFGLGETLRNAVERDFFNSYSYRGIQFRAGYASQGDVRQMPLIFNGTIFRAYSYKVGKDWITEIEAYDGGFAMVNSYTSMVIPPGAVSTDLLRTMASTLSGVRGAPIIGNFPAKSARGRVLIGSTWDLIQKESKGRATLDDNRVKCLQEYEITGDETLLISPDTGLTDSPRRSETFLDVSMLFAPSAALFQGALLQSNTQPRYNGSYRVVAFRHTGTISPSVAGEAKTTISLRYQKQEFVRVSGLTSYLRT